MTQMKANRIFQIKGTIGGAIDNPARQAAAAAQQKANDAYAATQTNQQAINDVNVTKTINEAGTTEEFQDLDGATNAKQLIAQKGYVDKQVNNLKSGIKYYSGQTISFNTEKVAPSKFADTTLFDKVTDKKYTSGKVSDYKQELQTAFDKGKSIFFFEGTSRNEIVNIGTSQIQCVELGKIVKLNLASIKLLNGDGDNVSNGDAEFRNGFLAPKTGDPLVEIQAATTLFRNIANDTLTNSNFIYVVETNNKYEYIAKKDITYAEIGE